MTLNYKVSGSERKKLVGIISTTLNLPTKYLGMPTAGYEVGPYNIDKAGTVTGPDSIDLEDALHQAGFDADGDTREYDTPDTYENCLGGMGAVPTPEEFLAEHSEPLSFFDRFEAETVTEQHGADAESETEAEDGHQPADVSQETATELEPSKGPQETGGPQEGETAASEAAPAPDGVLTIDVPLAGFTVEALDNLRKMVAAKHTLLAAALNTQELPINRTSEAVSFSWFPAGADSEHIQAYTALVSQLCKTAKEKRRVNAKAKDTEGSPKYAMRVFLLSIGMIGETFRTTRRVLLSNLSGSSAFCSNASEERWKAKHTGPKAETLETAEAVSDPGETEARE